MKQISFLLIAVAALADVAITVPASLRADEAAGPIFVTEIPPGYRDWRLISVAHEEGNLHSFAAVLGNDVAIKAYRDGKLPFPDGAIIAALHYGHVASEGTSRRRRTTRSLAIPNHSFRVPPRTFSLWSGIQGSTPRRVDGGSLTSTKTANPSTRRQ